MVEHKYPAATTAATSTTTAADLQTQAATSTAMSAPPHTLSTAAVSHTDTVRTHQTAIAASDEITALRLQLNEALQRMAQQSRQNHTVHDSQDAKHGVRPTNPTQPSAPELDSDDDNDHHMNLGPDLDGGDSPRSVPRSQFLSGQSVSRPRTIITEPNVHNVIPKTPAKASVSRSRDAELLDVA